MDVFDKRLTKTDVRHKLDVPSRSLVQLPDFGMNENQVDFDVFDSSGERWRLRCWKRKQGYAKPVITAGWKRLVAEKRLKVGDRVTLYRQAGDVHNIVFQRQITIFGNRIIAYIP